MKTIRLCSAAIAAIPNAHTLIAMWEDSNLEAYEEARGVAQWINEHSSQAFVLIEQWNNVHAPCHAQGGDHHFRCGVYQPDYALLLVPVKVWAAARADALGIQAEYETAGRRCKIDDPAPMPGPDDLPF
jgi:hypothetical protein